MTPVFFDTNQKSSLNELSPNKELLNHPNWQEEENKVELKKDTYAIVKGHSTSYFQLLWLNNNGEKISVPFWFDPSTFQWCCKNGQAHTQTKLDEIITCIFKHFKEKNV